MIPSANSWAPEKIAITEARKAKPGTLVPWIKYLPTTYTSTPTPNPVNAKPTRLASSRGSVPNPVIMLRACVTSLRNV